MNPAGLAMMVVSVGFVVVLTGYCFYRVLTTPETEERMHGPMDIEPDDKREGD